VNITSSSINESELLESIKSALHCSDFSHPSSLRNARTDIKTVSA
jgi:hypothetical protein